jgi:hypothetical protein
MGEATEVDEGDPEDVEDIEPSAAEEFPPGRFDAWRRRSAIGSVATGIALGLQQVFYPTDNEPVLVAEAPGDPPGEGERMRVVLDPDDPTKSVVIFPSDPPTS